MGSIFITCPVTRRPAYTGVEMDSDSFAILPALKAEMACSQCGGKHVWHTKKARLLDRGIGSVRLGMMRPWAKVAG